MEKSDYSEFRELLRKAAGSTNQTEMAEMTGLSRGHVNRLMGNAPISRPSAATLSKICAAFPDADPVALYASCGYGASEMSLSERLRRNGLQPMERAEKVASLMAGAVSRAAAGMTVYPDIMDVLALMARSSGERMKVSLRQGRDCVRIERDGSQPCQMRFRGERAACGKAEWKYCTEKKDIRTELYFVLTYIRSEDGVLPCGLETGLDALLEMKALDPPAEDMLYEDGTDPEDVPVYAEITTTDHKPTLAEERLLKAIFGDHSGDEAEIQCCDIAPGVVISGAPGGLAQWLLENRDYFRCGNEEESSEFMDDLESALPGAEDADAAAARMLGEMNIDPGEAVASVIRGRVAADREFMEEYVKRERACDAIAGRDPERPVFPPEITYYSNKGFGGGRLSPAVVSDERLRQLGLEDRFTELLRGITRGLGAEMVQEAIGCYSIGVGLSEEKRGREQEGHGWKRNARYAGSCSRLPRR